MDGVSESIKGKDERFEGGNLEAIEGEIGSTDKAVVGLIVPIPEVNVGARTSLGEEGLGG